jgi:hypothetical protein
MLAHCGPGSRQLFTATVNQKVTDGLATIRPQPGKTAERLAERIGLFSPTQDHVHADRRTLADFRGVIYR